MDQDQEEYGNEELPKYIANSDSYNLSEETQINFKSDNEKLPKYTSTDNLTEETPINYKLFSPAANDKPIEFKPLDLNNNDNIDSEQLEDPELVKHIAQARKVYELDIAPKKLTESEINDLNRTNREKFSNSSKDIDKLKIDIESFFSHLTSALKHKDWNKVQTLLADEDGMINIVKKLRTNIILVRREYDKLIENFLY